MNELVTDRASRPASPKHRLVSIKIFPADSAQPRLNRKRQRLPFPAAFSNAHRSGSIAAQSVEKQARAETLRHLAARNPIARFSLQTHHSRDKRWSPSHGIDQAIKNIKKQLEEIAALSCWSCGVVSPNSQPYPTPLRQMHHVHHEARHIVRRSNGSVNRYLKGTTDHCFCSLRQGEWRCGSLFPPLSGTLREVPKPYPV